MIEKLKQVNYLKLIKIVIGSTISMVLADVLKLKFYTAAGIITILTITDTKKETLRKALERLLSFFISLVTAYLSFYFLGFSIYSYSVFLLVFVFISYVLNLSGHIIVNAVLITHFLVEKSLSYDLILNEIYLMGIGASIGIILNLFVINTFKVVRHDQQVIEVMMKDVLIEFAIALNEFKKVNSKILTNLSVYLDKAINRAEYYINNNLLTDTQYYLRYMIMRKNQIAILKVIQTDINRLAIKTCQADRLALLLKEMSMTFGEYNNAIELIVKWEELVKFYKEDNLPKTRNEFETRAILYQILYNIEQFLLLKKEFALNLSLKERKNYWLSNQ